LARAGKLKKDDLMMYYHVDEFRIPGQYKKRRNVVTINFYLNNDYTDGDICMYDSISKKSFRYKPGPGDVVIMPSTSPFYHAVRTYAEADRYFLRTFIEYPVNETEEGSYDWEKLKEEEDKFIKNDLQLIHVSSNDIIVE
jgi:predicted 2-oxoglutarate/Fe(II)-dependent dioxygenase YbiX